MAKSRHSKSAKAADICTQKQLGQGQRNTKKIAAKNRAKKPRP